MIRWINFQCRNLKTLKPCNKTFFTVSTVSIVQYFHSHNNKKIWKQIKDRFLFTNASKYCFYSDIIFLKRPLNLCYILSSFLLFFSRIIVYFLLLLLNIFIVYSLPLVSLNKRIRASFLRTSLVSPNTSISREIPRWINK